MTYVPRVSKRNRANYKEARGLSTALRERIILEIVRELVVHDERRCFYCGEPAQSRDHFFPIFRYRRYKRKPKVDGPNILVPCCRPCNMKKGTEVFPTVRSARIIIYARRFGTSAVPPEFPIPRKGEARPGFPVSS